MTNWWRPACVPVIGLKNNAIHSHSPAAGVSRCHNRLGESLLIAQGVPAQSPSIFPTSHFRVLVSTSHPYYGSYFSKDVCGRAHYGLIGPAPLKSKLHRFQVALPFLQAIRPGSSVDTILT